MKSKKKVLQNKERPRRADLGGRGEETGAELIGEERGPLDGGWRKRKTVWQTRRYLRRSRYHERKEQESGRACSKEMLESKKLKE